MRESAMAKRVAVESAQQAFEALVKSHGTRAWRLASGLMWHQADAEDVLQEAFLIVASKSNAIPEDYAWPWLATIITNVCRNHWRKRKRRGDVSLQALGSSNLDHGSEDSAMDPVDEGRRSPDDKASDLELGDELREAIHGLPEKEREVVTLTHVSGLSHFQVSEMLDLPLGTVKSRAKRGIASLRVSLRKREPELVSAIAVLPFAAPTGGIENAISAWVASGKAAIATGAMTATTAATGLGTGSVIVANKGIIAVTAVVALSVGAISASVVTAQSSDEGTSSATEVDLGIIQSEKSQLQERFDSLMTQLRARDSQLDKQSSLIEELRRAQEQSEARAREWEANAEEQQTSAKKLAAELRVAQAKLTALAGETSAPEVSLDAKALIADIEVGIKNNDKTVVLKGMNELIAMGEAGIDAYFIAFDKVIRVGNAYLQGQNKLGLSQMEFVMLMPPEQRNLALKRKSAPSSARTYAAYALPYAYDATTEQKYEFFEGLLDSADYPDLALATISGISALSGDRARKLLERAIDKQDFPAIGRGQAIYMLVREYPEHVNWEKIELHMSDGSSLVSGAARIVVYQNKAPESGVLITNVKMTNTGAARSELETLQLPGVPKESEFLLGDIVTMYDGKAVESYDALKRKIAGAREGDSLVVDVHRNGQRKVLILDMSVYELTGKFVKKAN